MADQRLIDEAALAIYNLNVVGYEKPEEFRHSGDWEHLVAATAIDAVESLIIGRADATHICSEAIERARADERVRVQGIIEEADNHEEHLEEALREEKMRSEALRAELSRAQEEAEDVDDIHDKIVALETPWFRDDAEALHERWSNWRYDVLELFNGGAS